MSDVFDCLLKIWTHSVYFLFLYFLFIPLLFWFQLYFSSKIIFIVWNIFNLNYGIEFKISIDDVIQSSSSILWDWTAKLLSHDEAVLKQNWITTNLYLSSTLQSSNSMSTGIRLRNGKRIRCSGDGEATPEEDQATLVSCVLFIYSFLSSYFISMVNMTV